jgi:hypothetical protein
MPLPRLRLRLRTMMVLVALAAVGTGLFVWNHREQRRRTLLRQQTAIRLTAARKVEAKAQFEYAAGLITPGNYVQASRQLLEAERDASGGDAAGLAALVAHRDRVRKVCEELRARSKDPSAVSTPEDLISEAEAGLAEAEFWVARAEAGG